MGDINAAAEAAQAVSSYHFPRYFILLPRPLNRYCPSPWGGTRRTVNEQGGRRKEDRVLECSLSVQRGYVQGLCVACVAHLRFPSSGSLLANLNQNNLKYGAEMGRTSSFMQGAMTPLGASPNKNLGPEKVILLVCNRACSGHQGRRYLRESSCFHRLGLA